jgi:hypothetical protein
MHTHDAREPIIAAFVLALVAVAAHGQESPPAQAEALAGLTGIRVDVTLSAPPTLHLKADALRRIMIERLGLNGVPMLAGKDIAPDSGDPVLTADVVVATVDAGCTFRVRLYVVELANLARRADSPGGAPRPARAVTWWGGIYFNGNDEVGRCIRGVNESVLHAVDAFTNGFHQANRGL